MEGSEEGALYVKKYVEFGCSRWEANLRRFSTPFVRRRHCCEHLGVGLASNGQTNFYFYYFEGGEDVNASHSVTYICK